MTTSAFAAEAPANPDQLRHWHRPLLVLAALMVSVALAATIGSLIDSREVTGLGVWLKPLKFALSIVIYAVTLSWLIGQLVRGRRIAAVAGTLSAIALLVEMVVIIGFAAVGDTSHFNVSTALHAAAWSVMAASIVVVWGMTFVVSIALFRNSLGDLARTVAIRAGAAIALVGMGLAFLMTGPTAVQLDNFVGIAGAHTVGVADGGPGLPILGWSTVAGDLRIPHFVGMHALQVLPLAIVATELLGRRWNALSGSEVRRRLAWVAVAGYSGLLALVTAQALAGQSIVKPSGVFVVAGVALIAATVVGVVVAIAAPSGSEGRGRGGATTSSARMR